MEHNRSEPVAREQGQQAGLELYKTSEATTAWRTEEPDAPGLFAVIADEDGNQVPRNPEIDNMVIAIFDEALPETLGSIEVDGRQGLNHWYLLNVGFEPDKERGSPMPIEELIRDVASHLMLRYDADMAATRVAAPTL